MLIFQGVLKFMATPWCITFSPVFSREKSRHWVAVVVWSKSRMDLRWGRNHFSGGLVGGFKHFLCSPLPGEMIQFDSSFSNGLKPSPSGLFWKKGRNFGLSIWYPPIGTLQGTITYPTKGAKEIIDSLVPWDGICYRKGESLPFPSFFRVYVELRGCIYIYIFFVSSFVNKGDVVESPSDDGMNIIIKTMLSDYIIWDFGISADKIVRTEHFLCKWKTQEILGFWRAFCKNKQKATISRWRFQTFFIFIPTWGDDPIWQIFFKWVETTN